MYKAPYLVRSRHNDYVAFLEDQKEIWEAGNTPERAIEKLRVSARGYIRVRPVPVESDQHDLSGYFGYVEFKGVLTYSIIIFDGDGFPSGPFEVPHSRVEWLELKDPDSAWKKFWTWLAGLIFGEHRSIKAK